MISGQLRDYFQHKQSENALRMWFRKAESHSFALKTIEN